LYDFGCFFGFVYFAEFRDVLYYLLLYRVVYTFKHIMKKIEIAMIITI